ncbi:hypothetical protein [Aliiglaciecola litoralis]|uniref:Uncharacterized protein n=1 Tax=Aliiglaciecola litoralis TaxID=582857 RepID=A0ABP3WPJ6_9ALTE
MKPLLTLFFLAVTLSTVNSHANTNFSVTSKARGISAFDFTVTEIHRSESYSTLSIPKFQSRSAAASRWMMCVYAELAIARGFEYWSSIYTDDSGDNIVIVFPQTNSTSDPAFNNIDLLGTEPTISELSTYKLFCGLK